MLKEISALSFSSTPSNFVVCNNKLYFSANDWPAGPNGSEFWTTDGTSGGTALVKNINPIGGVPPGGSYPNGLICVNNTLLFAADDGTNGTELWTSDGTSGGTVMVKDINPSGYGSPERLTVFNSKLYFQADDGTHGLELWTSDGTSGGTVMVKDINLAGDSFPFSFTVFNSKLYFFASDWTDTVLWSTDGTTVTKEYWPLLWQDDYMVPVGSKLFFIADDGIHGSEPWSLTP
jgi:ELWxxDGT repeat protein